MQLERKGLSSDMRLIGHRTVFQVHFGKFISFSQREFDTNRSVAFNSSFVKVLCQPFIRITSAS